MATARNQRVTVPPRLEGESDAHHLAVLRLAVLRSCCSSRMKLKVAIVDI